MKVLITGFEPFGKDTINPSYEAVSRLPDTINNAEIIKIKLPVVFNEASNILCEEIDILNPDIVICVGLAGGRTCITPEMIAINLMDARIPDNKGNQPMFKKIKDNGPDGIFTTLPVNKIVESIKEANIPAEISFSAGTYVCNELMYSLLYKVKGTSVSAGFIHVPYVKGMTDDEPEMELEKIVDALYICIEITIKEVLKN